MPIITVRLSVLNRSGFIASVENDDEMESLSIAEGNSAKRTCANAAKKLRELADRFDALGDESEPCKMTTHSRINADRK